MAVQVHVFHVEVELSEKVLHLQCLRYMYAPAGTYMALDTSFSCFVVSTSITFQKLHYLSFGLVFVLGRVPRKDVAASLVLVWVLMRLVCRCNPLGAKYIVFSTFPVYRAPISDRWESAVAGPHMWTPERPCLHRMW